MKTPKSKERLSNRQVYTMAGIYDQNMEHANAQDVGSGAWVLITRTIPVAEHARPQLYGIYWGIPHEDRYDRQCCKINTTEDVVLLNHEYTVISEEKLDEYRNNGWRLRENRREINHALNLEIIEQGRSLCEEEREVIWALQLDGLDEEQACEEYFMLKHTDYNNYTICYLPDEDCLNELLNCFGSR